MRISDWSSDVCSSDLLARLRETLDQGLKRLNRLLRRMQLVSGIGEVDHVGDGMLRQARLTLCQQIGLLMLVAQKPLRRRIALPENAMPDDTETRRFPCVEKHVELVPAVKAAAQAPIFQNAVHRIESKSEERPGGKE